MIGDTNEEPKKKWRPVPTYDPTRYVERPYLRKDELARIRDNLDELTEIKQIEVPKETKLPETKTNKSVDVYIPEKLEIPENIPTITKEMMEKTAIEIAKNQITKDLINKSDVKNEINDATLRIVPDGYSKLDNKQNDKQNSTVNNNKIKKKVKRMEGEENNYVSPEQRRMQLEHELNKIEKDKKLQINTEESVRIANETKEQLKRLEIKILDMSKEFEGTVGNKVKTLDEKFGNLDTKFNTVHEKLKETCTGIECLTKDFKKSQDEKMELAECPECTKARVPFKSSFCPDCGAKMHSWTNDDGTPVKGWTPSWKKLEH